VDLPSARSKPTRCHRRCSAGRPRFSHPSSRRPIPPRRLPRLDHLLEQAAVEHLLISGHLASPSHLTAFLGSLASPSRRSSSASPLSTTELRRLSHWIRPARALDPFVAALAEPAPRQLHVVPEVIECQQEVHGGVADGLISHHLQARYCYPHRLRPSWASRVQEAS
jgi:hypothetical protein